MTTTTAALPTPQLQELFAGVPVGDVNWDQDRTIAGIRADGEMVGPGDLLFVCPGYHHRGFEVLSESIRRQLSGVVLDGWAAPPPDIPYLRVAHVRRALGTVAARFHHHPDRDLILIGVVGSSGRQELSWMIHHLLDSRDFPAGLINTKAIFLGRDRELPCLVTPEAAELFATLRAMREANCHLGVMEVPTSGIVRERMTCVGFHILVYHGHDDHGLPQDESEEMLNAKFELFLNPPGPPPDIAVVNRDDEYARPLLQRLPVSTRAITYGRHPDAHISARQIEDTDDGIYFRLIWPGGQTSIRLPWRSPPALQSTLGSLAVAFAKGHDLNHIASYVPGFAELRQGRMSSTVPQMHWTF